MDQSFCRACGMTLVQAQALVNESAASSTKTAVTREEKWLEGFGIFAFGGFAAVVWFAILSFVFFLIKYFIRPGEPIALLAVIIALFSIFSGMMFTYVFWRKVLRKKLTVLRSHNTANSLAARPEQPMLPDYIEKPASVTEGTTRKLAEETDEDWAMS
jgi:hypothetical protein